MLGTGAGLDDAKIDEIINEVDKNGDGVIQFDEFCELMKNMNQSEGLSRWKLSIQCILSRTFHVPAAQKKSSDLRSRWGYIDDDMKNGFNKRNKK